MTQEDLEHLKQQVRALQEKLEKGSGNVHNTTIHNHITNHQIVLNFDLRNGTQYDTSHMTPQKVGHILHKFRPCHLPQAGHHLLQLLYSNPANRNVFKNSLYSKICDVFMDQEWRSLPESSVLKTLTYDVFSAALDTYEQNGSFDEHAEVLNQIVSEEEPYEPEARECIRAALVNVSKQFMMPPRASNTK